MSASPKSLVPPPLLKSLYCFLLHKARSVEFFLKQLFGLKYLIGRILVVDKLPQIGFVIQQV